MAVVLMSAVALVGFCLTAVIGAAREASGRARCEDNLRQVGLGVVQFETARGHFPQAAHPNERLPPERRLSWQVDALTYMFCAHCWGVDEYSKMDASGPWDEGPQRRLAVLPLEPLICPSAPFRPAHGTHSGTHYVDRSLLTDPVPTAYVGITGLGRDAGLLPAGDPKAGVFGFGRVTRSKDVTDGTASTVMVVETSDLRGVWTAGGPATVRGVDPAERPYVGKGRPFGGNHPGGACAAFADGSVRFVRDTIDPKVFEALSTIAGGETLPASWDE